MTEYYDPKNEPGGEKKLLLAFLLVFVGIAVMQYLAPKPQAPVQPKPAPEQEQASPTPAVSSTPANSSKPGKLGNPVPENVASKQAASENETVIENSKYRIVFSNRGAVVKSWILKQYRNDKRTELDLVNPVAAQPLGYPLSLFSYDKNLEGKLNQALYIPSATGVQSAPASIGFEWSDGQITAHKRFTFDPDSYVVGVETAVTVDGKPVQALPQWPGGFGDQSSISLYGHIELVWEQEAKVTRKPPQSGWFFTGKSWVIGGQTVSGPFDWAGSVDAYFAAVFMPDSPRDASVVTLHDQVDVPRNPEKPEGSPKDKGTTLGVAVGNTNGITREHLFVGPKAVDLLENIQSQSNGPDLRGVVDWGWFGLIARPLFLWLKWTYSHWIPNWGWAIVFLTVVITGVLLPLRISSMKSSLKMQKIQPQVKAITEKYKRYSITDPRRAQMQQEMSELYKKEGVNPVGGCFPMLLQLPFLYAFYAMLGNAIELRQANWLWIHDLSSADPLHILPILIIISMFLSSRSMPQGGIDPTQQKMMQFMTPLMLGVISWNLAAGLGIYWAISNLLMWVQQMVINQTEFGKQVRKTVAKRATRKR